MKSICFIANKYPNPVEPNGLVFVQQLVWTIADMGIDCTVICPLAVNLYPRLRKVPYQVVEKTENGGAVRVFFPKFFGLGQSHYILGRSPAPLTTDWFTQSVRRTIQRQKLSFDAVYGHFLAPAGVCAARIGRQLNIPAFMAHGESTAWSIDQYGPERARRELSSLSGIIAVSTKNQEMLVEKGVAPRERIRVFPNGYRPERFYPRDRAESRARLGWAEEPFVAGFVGSFDERKGVLRLQQAAERAGVYFACAGKGAQTPGGERCLHAAPVNNAELPYFYSAVDAFVLPTQNEGCCNAIIEAMACGCPIVSADRLFNYDICDRESALLVDPDSVPEIADAIARLRDDAALRARLSQRSLERSKTLTLGDRAKGIVEYMNRCAEGR